MSWRRKRSITISVNCGPNWTVLSAQGQNTRQLCPSSPSTTRTEPPSMCRGAARRAVCAVMRRRRSRRRCSRASVRARTLLASRCCWGLSRRGVDFPELFAWFYARENDELREQKKRDRFDYRLNDLSAVRRAIESMLDGVYDPRVETDPLRFLGVRDTGQRAYGNSRASDQVERWSASGAGAGGRSRSANGAGQSRTWTTPLASEAIVLIDEVELHLHPSWQQRIPERPTADVSERPVHRFHPQVHRC